MRLANQTQQSRRVRAIRRRTKQRRFRSNAEWTQRIPSESAREFAPLVLRQLTSEGGANVLQGSSVSCAEGPEVGSSFRQTGSVGATPQGRIPELDGVVFPAANRADDVRADVLGRSRQSFAARAGDFHNPHKSRQLAPGSHETPRSDHASGPGRGQPRNHTASSTA